jgi:hypothetical protein
MQIIYFLIKYKTYALLLGGIILLTIIVLINNPRKQFRTGTQTPTSTAPANTAQSTRSFNNDPQARLIERVTNREPLSPSDVAAKDYILSRLEAGKHSGQLYQSKSIIIEYVASANLFQVEILTEDINQAKTEAVTWFQDQGLSVEGICKHPISFYLNFDIKNQLGEAADGFNPLPPDC